MSVLLHHTKIGQGPNLVILHGLFGSSSNWRNIANKLSDQYTVYCLDARNHGESPWSESMTYDEMAEDTAHFFDQYQLETANLIGHSMGGKTAMTFALNYPEKLNQLVIVDIAPKAYQHGDSHKHTIKALQNLNLAELHGRRQAELILTAQLDEPKPVIQFLLQNLVYKNQQFQWRINLAVLNDSLDIIMDEIGHDFAVQNPSMFLYGKNSNYIQSGDYSVINVQFPNSTIKGLENAGHWLHAEHPNQFINLVRQFLNDSSGKI